MVLCWAMFTRTTDLALARTALRRSRVVALLGPRQYGKTTLAREFVSADFAELLTSLARLAEPETVLPRE